MKTYSIRPMKLTQNSYRPVKPGNPLAEWCVYSRDEGGVERLAAVLYTRDEALKVISLLQSADVQRTKGDAPDELKL